MNNQKRKKFGGGRKYNMPVGLFYTGSYSYLRKEILIGGLFLTGFSIFLTYLIYQIVTERTWSSNLALSIAFLGVLATVLFCNGTFFLSRWIIQKRLLLEITDTGITYGKKFRPWTEISWIGRINLDGYPMLAYRLKGGGFFSYCRKLAEDRPLSSTDCEALMEKLRNALQKKHPHITFGGTDPFTLNLERFTKI
ncbi:MAG TPA: hypothetical protein VGH19_04320 [Verrucomicrobiae bacterium]